MTRRTFGKLAIAAFAKIDSKIHGVTLGAQTYSFRDRPLDACIAAMKEVGLGEAELITNFDLDFHLAHVDTIFARVFGRA